MLSYWLRKSRPNQCLLCTRLFYQKKKNVLICWNAKKIKRASKEIVRAITIIVEFCSKVNWQQKGNHLLMCKQIVGIVDISRYEQHTFVELQKAHPSKLSTDILLFTLNLCVANRISVLRGLFFLSFTLFRLIHNLNDDIRFFSFRNSTAKFNLYQILVSY